MQKYTQQVNAIQFDGSFKTLSDIVAMFEIRKPVLVHFTDKGEIDFVEFGHEDYVGDSSRSDFMVSPLDYVVQDIKGNVYPMNRYKFKECFSKQA